MNIFLWVIQILLAIHTAIGAVWKFTNTAEQTMPSFSKIPHSLWITMSAVELLCAIGLVMPLFSKSLAIFAPLAASFIAVQMLLFCMLHFFSAESNNSPMIYWLVVFCICILVAYARQYLQPIV